MQKYVHSIVVILLFINIAWVPNSLAALSSEYERVGSVTYYGTVVARNGNTVYMKESAQAYTTVTVNKSDGRTATSVVLVDKNFNVKKHLSKISDTQWELGTIQGEVKRATQCRINPSFNQ